MPKLLVGNGLSNIPLFSSFMLACQLLMHCSRQFKVLLL
uniref:Uncharacterized protein n=1 Tax=Arundo donax TaxID=35708 RepID=A0A0A9C4F0_ARUDO